MSVLETELLSDLIDRKRSCLVQLHEIGRKQLELVRRGTMTDLLELLATKQHVLMQLQQVESDLDPFRGDDPEQRCWQSPQKRQACADRLRDCETLLAEITAQERQSEQELIRRRDQIATQLEGVHAASYARGAYLAEPRSAQVQLNLVAD